MSGFLLIQLAGLVLLLLLPFKFVFLRYGGIESARVALRGLRISLYQLPPPLSPSLNSLSSANLEAYRMIIYVCYVPNAEVPEWAE